MKRREGTISIMPHRLSWPLWRPPEEALESIAAVITSHWNAAKAYRGDHSFWPTAESWLRQTLGLPLHERRQAHQVSLGVRVRAESKLGTAIVDEIEFHVAAALDQ